MLIFDFAFAKKCDWYLRIAVYDASVGDTRHNLLSLFQAGLKWSLKSAVVVLKMVIFIRADINNKIKANFFSSNLFEDNRRKIKFLLIEGK